MIAPLMMEAAHGDDTRERCETGPRVCHRGSPGPARPLERAGGRGRAALQAAAAESLIDACTAIKMDNRPGKCRNSLARINAGLPPWSPGVYPSLS